jgi:tetratricopeptide (TPR) repeat protein
MPSPAVVHANQNWSWTAGGDPSPKAQVDGLAGMEAMIESGRASEVLIELDRLLADDPSQADVYVARSWVNFNLMRWRAAESDATAAIELGTREVNAWNNRARVRTIGWRIDEALSDYDSALRVNPRSTLNRVGRALLWTQLGEYRKALQCAEEARDLAGQTAEVRACTAQINLARGDLDAALKGAGEVLHEVPGDADARVLRVRILCMLQEFDAALREISVLSEADAQSPATAIAKAFYALHQRDFEALLSIGQALTASRRELWLAYGMQRIALTELLRNDAALQLSREAMQSPEFMPEAGLDCVESLLELERTAEAEVLLDSISREYGHYPVVALWHSTLLVFRGRLDEAYAATKALHARYPRHSGIWFEHALNCLRTSRWQEALDCAEQPDAPNREFGAMLVIARASHATGSQVEALVAAKRALALLPATNSQDFRESRRELNTARCHSLLAILVSDEDSNSTHRKLAEAAMTQLRHLLPAWHHFLAQDPLLPHQSNPA